MLFKFEEQSKHFRNLYFSHSQQLYILWIQTIIQVEPSVLKQQQYFLRFNSRNRKVYTEVIWLTDFKSWIIVKTDNIHVFCLFKFAVLLPIKSFYLPVKSAEFSLHPWLVCFADCYLYKKTYIQESMHIQNAFQDKKKNHKI